MFCKNCGKDLGEEKKKFCPYCGQMQEENFSEAVPRKSGIRTKGNKKHVITVVLLLVFVVVLFAVLLLKNRAEESGEDIIAWNFWEEEKTPEELIIGTWYGDDFDITFTEDGYMRLGNYGVQLGGDVVNYGVQDEDTLYISGGDFPAGMAVEYHVTETELVLVLWDEMLTFTR